MPYSFKTNELKKLPQTGEELSFVSQHSHVKGDFSLGEWVYVFVEDGSVLGKRGGLVGRGVLTEAAPNQKSVALTIRFDGTAVSIGLATRDLDRFAHPQNYEMPELNCPPLGSMFPILRNIAEVRRNTTGQPIHELTEEAANWLNLYHFEKAKV